MARTISTKLAVEGESAYKQAISSCSSELATLKSSLALVESEFRGNANSMEALTAKGAALDAVYRQQQEKISKLGDALQNAQRAQEEYASRVSTAQDNIQQCQQALDALKNSTGDTSKEQEELTKELDKWNAELEEAQAGQTAAERGVQNWQRQLNNAQVELNGLSDAVDQNNRYLREAEASADGCAHSIDEFGDEVDSSAGAIDQLAAALAAAGIAKTVKEISDALMECMNTFASFESQMSTVQAISGATADQMDALGEKAKYMGATTSFTATEAGQALEYMAMAGWKTEDMLGGLEGIMHLAAASGENLATTSDIVTDALTAFGLTASDSARFADVLASASSNANTNVSMMGETFKYAAPVAGALGYSIEDTALAIGLMANAGIKGSQAGTALRGMLTNLAKPSEEVAGYMEELGISLTDSAGHVRSLSELLDLLRERFAGLTEAEQAEYAAGIAGKNAMSGLLAVVNASEADYQKLTEAINTCNGSAKEMSEIRLDNYAGQMTLLGSAADGLKLAIGEQLTPALTELAKAGTDGFTWATEFVEENPWVVGAVAGVTVSFAALTAGVALYSHEAELATVKTAILNAVMETNPAVFVASALIGLVTAIGIYCASADDADKATREFTKSLKETKSAYEDLMSSMEEQQADTAAVAAALKGLLAVEGKSASQKEEIKRLVDQLNESIPDLGLAYDAEKDALVGVTEAELDAKMARAQAQEEHEAQMDRLAELRVEGAEIATRLAEAETALGEAQAENREELPAYFDIAADYNAALNESSGNASALENNVRELTATQEENAAQIAELEAATNAYAEQQAEATLKTETMTSTMEGLIAEMKDLQTAYDESYAAAMESIDSQLGLFNKLDGKAKESIGDLIDTLKGQVEYMDTYAANIQKAMEIGVDEGLIKKLSDGSEKSAQILAAIVKGGEDDIAALNEQFAKVDEGKEKFSTTVAEMETDFSNQMTALVEDLDKAIQEMNLQDDTYTIGANNIQGLINGTVSKKRELIQEYIQLGYDALEAYKRAVDQHSPSKEFEKAGSFDMQGLAIGMKNSSGKVMETVEDVAKEAKSRLDGFLGDMEHTMFLAEKNGALAASDAINAYRLMQEKIHDTAEWYRAQGYSETSDEIQKLQKLWWGYANSIKSAQEDASKNMAKAAKETMDGLNDWIGDMEHNMFLLEKTGKSTLEQTVADYRAMQEKIHDTAEWYRAQGYSETSDEIQKLQKLWWGYADSITSAQEDAFQHMLSGMKANFDSLSSFASMKSGVGDLEYQLWERTEGKYATGTEKYAKQLELLSSKEEDQRAVVEAAAAAYEAAVEQYGEGTQESYEYQKALLKEKLALQDLLDEIEKVTKAKRQMAQQEFIQQAEARWEASALGIATAGAVSAGYADPYDIAKKANLNVVMPDGKSFSAAYNEVAQAALDGMVTHLPSTLEAPRTQDTLGRKMEDLTAATVNAISGIAQGGGAVREVVRLVTVDGKVLASASFDDFVDYGSANGTPILNPKR